MSQLEVHRMSNGLTLPFTGTFDSSGQVFAITQPGHGGTAIWGFSGGVKADGSPGIGVAGTSYNAGTGVSGVSDSGAGVRGQSNNGTGVYGTSTNGSGVVGVSQTQDAINGTSSSPQHAGVSANNNGGGFGLWAKAKIAGYFYGDGGYAIQAVSTSTDTDAVIATSSSPQHAAVSANNGSGGFGLWAKAKTAGYFYGDGGYAIQAVSTSTDTDAVIATSSSPQHAAVSANNSSGGFGLWAKAKVAGYFDGDVQVTGDIRLLGADVAENFRIAEEIAGEPGTVMVLDDTGAVTPSRRPYDKCVVGVVSGAGCFRPGLVLDTSETRAPRARIALVGKVICKVDASAAPIEIGDLLTTSETLGHAMKARDAGKAFGAVIGKALGSLESGRGIVPILVALQ
jgi:hypothetical protein